MTEFLFQILQLYGSPVAMYIWFQWSISKKMDALNDLNHKQVVIMAVLVKILGDKRSSGAIPEELFDEITGVEQIPLPEKTKDALRRLQSQGDGK